MQLYAEVDVTGWSMDGPESVGTKPKRWLQDPESGQRWLMKDATYSAQADGTRYRKGDDWSERIATGVADILGVPAARTELALAEPRGEKRLGVLSRSVLEAGEELVLGNELLENPVSRQWREGYTVDAVRIALHGVDATLDAGSGLSAWDVFAGYLVLDALIGNTDRHEENWAVIDRHGTRRLAPSFDHASSLGFLLHDEERERRLTTRDSGYAPERWADRARSKFMGSPHPVVVALEALRTLAGRTRDRWLDRCEDAERLVEPIRLVPAQRMSQSAREFAERVLRRNRERLLRDGRALRS